jgi:hypothetical protein
MENHGKGQKIHPAADFISVPIQGNFDFGIVRHCSALFGIVRHCSALFGIVRHCSALFGIVRHWAR